MQQAGADALELNIYFCRPIRTSRGAKSSSTTCDLVRRRQGRACSIPVAVKLGPTSARWPNFAASWTRPGADALVLFNRFYQPDFDLEALEVVPSLYLSDSDDLLLRLHWVAVLYGQHQGRHGGHRRRPYRLRRAEVA